MMEFINWIFSWQWDSVTLPWLDANKITFGFLAYAPYWVYVKYRENKARILEADREYDKRDKGEE